jgi:hypothetical protein
LCTASRTVRGIAPGALRSSSASRSSFCKIIASIFSRKRALSAAKSSTCVSRSSRSSTSASFCSSYSANNSSS